MGRIEDPTQSATRAIDEVAGLLSSSCHVERGNFEVNRVDDEGESPPSRHHREQEAQEVTTYRAKSHHQKQQAPHEPAQSACQD